MVFRSRCRDCHQSCLAVFSHELLQKEVGRGRLLDGCSVHDGGSVTDFVVDEAGVTQLRESGRLSICGSLAHLEAKVACTRWSTFFKRQNGYLAAGVSLTGLHYCLFDRDLRCLDHRTIEHAGSFG